MAVKKEYYCKDCGYNNNGWCPKKKKNGLKNITAADCNEKILENVDGIEIEEDILSKANKEIACSNQDNTKYKVPVNIAQSFKNEEKNNELIKFIKENLRLDIDQTTGLIPGSKIITIQLKCDDELISDIDFGYSPSKGIYI